MWHPTKLALGAAIAAGFVAYHVALETSCAEMSRRGDGGELVITSGGITQTGDRVPAPRYAFSGEIPLNGTADAKVIWIENLCDSVLDCSSCPPQMRSTFNASVLDGTLLICYPDFDVRLNDCGFNRLTRALGRTGLVGLADGGETDFLEAPGVYRQTYRVGEHRDALPRDGDLGIPFPYVDIWHHTFNPILEALISGTQMRAVITPTATNPWQSTMCGYWKPLRMMLMFGHVWIAECAASCFIGHVQSAGVRFDLAQAASVTEVMAHTLLAFSLHDPWFTFHWGVSPEGTFIAAVICPLVLTCSSTFLLAGFWCVSHAVFARHSPAST